MARDILRLVAAMALSAGCAHESASPVGCFRVEGATAEQLELIQGAVDEWTERAGAELSIDQACARRITLENFDEPRRMGEWDGHDIALRPGTTGIPGADAAILRWEALHELGHALGLGHSKTPEDAMHAYHTFQPGLTERDLEAYWRLAP